MKPLLFEWWGYPVYAYAFTTLAAYFLGIIVVVLLARRDQRKWRELLDVLLVMVLSALLGSKLFHVFFEARAHLLSDGREAQNAIDLLLDDPWHWLRFFDPGYVFWGGLLVSIGATLFFLRQREIRHPWAYGDYVAPALALGICLGRLGCFMAGCCYGKPAPDLFWGIAYPVPPLSELGVVHPAPLYDVLLGLILLIAIAFWYLKKRFDGEVFVRFLGFYCVGRFITEFFRGDFDRGLWFWGLSTAQIISVATMIVLVWTCRKQGLEILKAPF